MEDLHAGTDPTDALRRVVSELYAVEPAGFVAARKEWVTRLRSAGLREVAKEVGALRRPSVSAAAVNALVRAGDPVVGRLRDVGARMRQAQSALDAATLAGLRGERDELLRDWVAAAAEHAPAPLAAAAGAEVRDTAIAALADAAATEVVTSGHLTRALSYSGFGEVDVADAVARTSTGVVLTRIEGGAAGPEDDESDEVEGDEVEAEGDEVEDDTDESDEEDLVDHGDLDEQVGGEDEDDELEEEVDGNLDEDDEVDEDVDLEDPEDEQESADEELLARLAMELDEAEKEVAAARAARRKAADAAARASSAVAVAQEQVTQAERLLASAIKALEKATTAEAEATTSLEDAEDELRASREHRDATKVALEEAEDDATG